ncbi:hypothetical protein DFH06DRAFT_897293, partial [Mycena polygramma]
MIALCRAKCWIIQLRDDHSSNIMAQRGIRGHVIVYPQRPSAIAQTLPPSIDDIITPICVIFVGAKAPTAEWLRTKATPLIVRKERVQKALAWLKIHNHLYKDVAINNAVLDELPAETILPVHIEHIVPDAAMESTVSDYVPTVDISTAPDLSEILRPPSSDIPFSSVVVADVDPHASSNILKSAALKHLKQAGSNYIEIPHDPGPMNEFKNPDLFPLMYPTLFPYGLGGLENPDRRTPLGFKTHIKH